MVSSGIIMITSYRPHGVSSGYMHKKTGININTLWSIVVEGR